MRNKPIGSSLLVAKLFAKMCNVSIVDSPKVVTSLVRY